MWDTDQTSISALPPEKVVSRSKLTFRHVPAELPQPTCLGESIILHSEGSGGGGPSLSETKEVHQYIRHQGIYQGIYRVSGSYEDVQRQK